MLSWPDTISGSSSAVSKCAIDCLADSQTDGFNERGQTLAITQTDRLTRHGTEKQLVALEDILAFLSDPGNV